ncbi:tyrosine-type recombinase/integrase [Miltoncostaea oceani]|uniref:tyrosine-type recombinase/integrase n=1 Tax=Miltoncostaea oceani TaxID=2843216 RepID=UPI001C3D9F38|nr:site-specific integrase [Miltoncostaea oceani]
MASIIRERHRPLKPWRVDYSERGNRRTRRFATRKEAQAFAGDVAQGKRQSSAERITLERWLGQWVTTHGIEWEPRTRRDRGRYADNWIVPGLGKMLLRDLSRRDIRAWRAEMLARGATPYVANAAVRVLSAALGDAVHDELIVGNPCRGLEPLKRQGVQRREPATLAEVEGIRAVLERPRDRAMVALMAYAGLRPSERPSLRWADVRAATLVIRSATASDGREKGTKTEGTRTVPIIPALAEDLEALERRDDGLVVGPVDHDNWSMRVWRPARERVGCTRTPYSLRHTFASLLIAEGKSVHEVARLLGHSTPALTLSTYGHLFDEAQLAGDESMAEAVARARHEAASMSATMRPMEPEGR